MPADETPRQKKHASQPCSFFSIGARFKRSAWMSSRSFGCCCPIGLRPTDNTCSTPGSSRHSRRTPCPTMPVAPKSMTFISTFPVLVVFPTPLIAQAGVPRQRLISSAAPHLPGNQQKIKYLQNRGSDDEKSAGAALKCFLTHPIFHPCIGQAPRGRIAFLGWPGGGALPAGGQENRAPVRLSLIS